MTTEARELHGQEAVDVIAEAKAGDLELAPVYLTEHDKKLQRAGFLKSMRSADRAGQKEVLS